MFTGLVEDVGTVAGIRRTEHEARITITSPRIVDGLAIGDSVAVNGACLTAVALGNRDFTALATAETLRRTTLGHLTAGSHVNLERALRPDSRLGGHFVLGHVDGVGEITALTAEGAAVRMEIRAPEDLLPLMVSKGSVAVDGISLTIAGLLPHGFWIALIPHTLGATTLQHAKVGTLVNLETDIIGKYVARLLGWPAPPDGPPHPLDQGRGELTGRLSLDTLRRHGFA